MDIITLTMIAVGLSMDAFAVAVCKGLAAGKCTLKNALKCGVWFGSFQAIMPFIGFILGIRFKGYISAFDHWIALMLLSFIGFGMIKSSLDKDEPESPSFGAKAMLAAAVATSIDALALGITFAFLSVNIYISMAVIGGCAFIISAMGVKIGSVFGGKSRKKAEVIGGVILIILGIKILLEHLR
ncbi:MAG: manganese efflux pump MntP family protein [Oscillospiraceae bacterium]|nr:manganese efflux pump MntP family protein [Oscillospiraceae bacterium]